MVFESEGEGREGSGGIVPSRQGLRVLQRCRRALGLFRVQRLSLSGNRESGRWDSAILSNVDSAAVMFCQDNSII